jgi:hypothetical protein
VAKLTHFFEGYKDNVAFWCLNNLNNTVLSFSILCNKFVCNNIMLTSCNCYLNLFNSIQAKPVFCMCTVFSIMIALDALDTRDICIYIKIYQKKISQDPVYIICLM